MATTVATTGCEAGRPFCIINDREEQAAVRVGPLSAFIGGGAMEDVRRVVVATDPGLTVYPPSDVVARALTRVGETGYWLPTNNCEHFARWAVTGEAISTQTDWWIGCPCFPWMNTLLLAVHARGSQKYLSVRDHARVGRS